MSDENVEHIRQSFTEIHSPRRAGRELIIPATPVWRVLQRRLIFKPYRIQSPQALHIGDKERCVEFCEFILQNVSKDGKDAQAFHNSGVIHRKLNSFPTTVIFLFLIITAKSRVRNQVSNRSRNVNHN
ncbi:hypothetical protein AVEN_10251-1 [Araneus ventricosus]|uniref:Uncharacterized protein n=1 Tax=Araneus ventricosus TaxID=182803 RepID=A0A4Y2FL16_ARAVE|nr:hypothetical protein AVEN_10251-1 [Araneus ventricosus]